MAYKSWKPLRNTAVGRHCLMGKLRLCWRCREYQFLCLFLDCSYSTKFQFVFSHLFLWSCFEACPFCLYCHQQLFSCYIYKEKDDMNMVLNKGHTDEAILMHYWPSLRSGWLDIIWLLFLAYLWTNTKLRSRKGFKKEWGWYSSHLDWPTLVNQGFLNVVQRGSFMWNKCGKFQVSHLG